jgi:gliding motility-associated-like protein
MKKYLSLVFFLVSGLTILSAIGNSANAPLIKVSETVNNFLPKPALEQNGALKPVLTVTADAASKVYGEVNPVLNFTYSGFTDGDNEEDLTIKPVASTSVSQFSAVGVHAYGIWIHGGADDKYDFTYVAADFTVTKAILTVTADSKSKTYGAANPALTYVYSGWVNGVEVIATPPVASTLIDLSSNVGVYSGSISVGGGFDNNYAFTYVDGDFTVTKTTLTVAAVPKSKIYYAANPALTFTYNGWMNSEGESDLTTVPVAATTVTTGSSAGVYSGAITVSGGEADNYAFSYTTADFTVTKAMLTVTAAAKTKVYGAANPSLTFGYSGWQNSEDQTVLTTEPVASTTITTSTSVGAYSSAITLAGGVDENYDFTYTSATFTVTKATLTVTAEAKSKVFGAANPSLTLIYSGWQNSEDQTVLTTQPVASTTVSTATSAGVYTGAITVAGGADENYAFSYAAADFTITKAMLTVTADAKSKLFGAANPLLTFTYSGWKNGNNESVLTTKPVASTTVDVSTAVGVWIGAITLAGGVDENYDFTYVAANFTVSKNILTVTAVANSKVYGAANPSLTLTYSGFLNGNTASDLTTAPTARATSITLTTAVGTYTNAVTVAGGVDETYSFTYVFADFTVTAAPLTITANSQSKTYGTAFTFAGTEFSTSGLVNSDAVASASIASAGAAATATVAGSPYTITIGSATGTGLSNYSITYTSGSFTVSAKALSITANNQTKVYGTTFTFAGTEFTTTGLVNTDAVSGVSLSSGGAASSATVAGSTYSIIPSSATGTGLSNYSITYVNGLFTVTPKPITVTVTAGQTKVYGASDPGSYAYTVSPALISGDSFSGALSRAAGENVGNYAIGQNTLSAGSNYAITFVGSTFAITAKPVTVTVTAGQTKVYGASDPGSFTYSVSPALSSGDVFTGALSRASGENVGSYAIGQNTLSAGSNYTITFVPDNYTITVKAITVTADAGQSKVYGATDPVFTYAVSPSMIGSDGFTGALSRAAGENIGNYAISKNTLSAGTNYTITFVSNNFAITAKPVTVSVTAGQTKVYGASEPGSFAYTVSPALIGSDAFTGALSRASGENVGNYAIGQNTLSAGSNYTITFVGNNFAITAKPVTVTVTAGQTKVYGAADPGSYTYTVSPALIGSDAFTGALSRAAGENVGSYAIGQNTLSAGSNYTITFVADNFTITAKPVTVTATASQTKVYGEADPTFAYTVSPALKTGDSFTGALSRVTGENIGTYAITQGNLFVNANYAISFVSNNFSITAKAITVTATAGQSKVYGAVDPVFAYTVSPSMIGSDSFTGSLNRAAGENIGNYAIGQNTLSAGTNYTITFVSNNFAITAKPVTVTVTAGQTKVYGASEPGSFAYTVSPALIGSDAFTGALSRAAGENVGNYAIGQNTLSAGTNYTITFVADNFAITAKPVTVTVTAGQTKVYGASDPGSYTYSVSPALIGSDAFSGALSRAAGENVGNYAIGQNTLSAGSNYTITFVGNNFTITAKAITVTVTAGQTKVYGASEPGSFTYTVSPALSGSDAFSGALSRAAGENIGTYAIGQNTLTAGANYTITFVADNFTITVKSITVTVTTGQTKVYGADDPVFAYTVSPSLIGSDAFTGVLSRAAGENIGTYAIGQNTLSAGTNYTITFVAENFTITVKPITITATAGQTKVYGASDPVFAYTVSPAMIGTDGFTGALSRVTGENIGNYAITPGNLYPGTNYAVTFIPNDFAITAKPITVTVTAGQTKVYGASNPGSYTYTVSPALIGSDAFSGALSRATGENVGNYAIGQNTLSAGTNYTITFIADNFAITAKPVTVTASAGQTKVYGVADPGSYTYTVSPDLVGSDAFTGALSRAAGENVGSYAIGQNTLSAGTNYTITFVADNFTIIAKAVTVTATASQTKVYGVADPVFAYTVSPSMIGSDTFTGALSRAAGESIGSYAIGQGTLANTNYTITFVSDNFTITAKPVTVTVTAGQTKVYGETDPVFAYTVSPALIGSDAFTGVLSRAAGESIGNYAIGQNTLSAGTNYIITFVADNFAITAKPVTVTATAGQTKVYGEADPGSYAYTVSPALIGSDAFTGALSRAAGENVGNYAIGKNTLTAGTNYTITFVADNFEITAKPVTVTASAGQTKVYGETDPVFTYTVSPALVGSDAFTGALSRVAGENEGSYAYTIGSLSAGANYTISVAATPEFSITAKAITVTATAGQTKVYGEADPVFAYTVSPALVSGDLLTGALGRAAGENIGTYAISQGTLANTNYIITFVPDNFTITIKPVTVTVTAGQTKVYGEADPVFAYTVSPALIGSDAFTGVLSRAAGESIGNYAIGQNTLSAGANYTITFVADNFAITAKPVTVTVTAGQAKVYGASDPGSYAYTVSPALIGSDAFTGALSRAAGENIGNYAVGQNTLSAGTNYTITFVADNFAITAKPVTVTATAGQTKVYGGTDPVFAYTVSPALIGSDAFTGKLSRAAGENAGTYGITQGDLDAGINYTITFTPSDFTITTRPVTVTATDAQTKIFGEVDPGFAYTFSPALIGSDLFTGLLSRETGENTGTYAITIGTLGNSNYEITFVPADFTITVRPVTVTANTGQTKVYGDDDPLFTYSAEPALLGSDLFTGTLSRTAGEDVGTYAITQGDLDAGANYIIVFVPKDFTITAKAITITAAADQKKIYGEADPVVYTYTVNPSLIGTDVIAGLMSRVPGENAGNYAYAYGTLDAGSNYTLTVASTPEFTILPKTLVVTVVSEPGKIYGAVDPVFTFEATGFELGDDVSVITGALSRDPGENTGVYPMNTGTLTAGINYVISLVPSDFTITAKELEITASSLLSKIYGDPDPVFTFEADGFESGDDISVITGLLSRNPGEDVGAYPIVIGSLSAGDNYVINFITADFTITKAILTATADNKTITYGDAVPELTITYSGFKGTDLASVVDVLPSVSTLAVTLSDAGIYTITITGGSDNNYDLALVDGNLEISKAVLSVTADDKTRIYLEENPALTFTYSGFISGQDQSVLDVVPVVETAADANSDAGFYEIIVSGGSDNNYRFAYIVGTLNVNKADQVITFEAVPDGMRMTTEYQLVASASSALEVTFEFSDPDAGSVIGNVMTILKDGILTINALQAGDNNWNPAPSVPISFIALPTFDNVKSLFTPNGDGMNDYWYIPDLESYGDLQVSVFNRYGQKVYQSDSYKNDWDGTWNAYPLPSASYYYIFNSSTKGYIKGVVNIIR